MTNNFATVKNRPRSEKILLVRLKPGRQVIDELSHVGGTTYDMSFPYPVSALKVDGIAFSRNELTALSINEFSYNEATQVLTVRLNDTIDNFVAVIAYYYLFYSNVQNRQAYEDPEDPTTTLRNWEGRVVGSPAFETTQEDIIESVLTIGNTSVNLINDDDDFQQYLTDKDSFSRKEARVWQCLNKVENIQKHFFGFISSISIGNQVNISIDNPLSALSDNFYTNGTSIKSKFNTTDYPNCHPNFRDTPIIKFFARVSMTKDLVLDYGNDSFYVLAAAFNYMPYVITKSNTLVNISFDMSETRTTNRKWAACVAGSATNEKTEIVSNVSLIDSSGFGKFYRVTVADNSYYRPGDNLIINFGSGNTYKNRVSGLSTDKTKLEIATGSNILTNGMTITRPAIPFICTTVKDPVSGKIGYSALSYYTDYLYSIDANGVYNITFTNDFESNTEHELYFPDGKSISRDQQFFYRVYNHEDISHGNVIKQLLEQAGLDVDTSSITAANLAVPNVNTNFSIPFEGESNFPNILQVIERLLASTFSMLSITNDFKVSYHIIDSVASTDEINDNDYMLSSLKQDIKYRDLVSQLVFQNEHGESIYYLVGGFFNITSIEFKNDLSTTSIYSQRTEYLHEIKKQKTITHLVEDISSIKNRMMSVLGNRKLSISFVTKGINFTSKLNDNFMLVTNKVLGITGSKNIKVFSLNKSANETQVKGLDLLGL